MPAQQDPIASHIETLMTLIMGGNAAVDTLPAKDSPLWPVIKKTLEKNKVYQLYVNHLSKNTELQNIVGIPSKSDLQYLHMHAGLQGIATQQKCLAAHQDISQADITAIIWKGAAHIWTGAQKPGLRPMVDMDYDISFNTPEQIAAFWRFLEYKGYQHIDQDAPDAKEARHYQTPNSLVLDIHFINRFMQGLDPQPLIQEITVPGAENPATILNPTAHLALMTTHLYGHLKDTGPRLSWMLDFAYHVQKHEDIDAELLQSLVTDPGEIEFLGNILGFVEKLGVAIPQALQGWPGSKTPYTVDRMLREQRVAQSGGSVTVLAKNICLSAVQLVGQEKVPFKNLPQASVADVLVVTAGQLQRTIVRNLEQGRC